MLTTDLHVFMLLSAQIFFVIATLVFAISAVDDLLIDGYFYVRLIIRKIQGKPYVDTPSVAEIEDNKEQPLALMLPAWQESDVLFGAVANLIKTIDYKNYHVFIGVYPNDTETRAEADRLSQQFRRVHTVISHLPGPTCKADCLNEIIKSIFAFEAQYDVNFSGVIMQDAEDVIHPLSMKLFNYYLPEHDLIQIPVYSLKRHWWQLTGGHYMDEFAEFHSKEILVRQSFANVVPGAGVGTAMSKKALEFARQQSGEYYNTQSLTEDYEFSFRTQGSDLKQGFARVRVPEDRKSEYSQSTDIKGDRTGRYIATREYFPNRFWWSVRQKTRWTIGISFQAWASMGWKGSWKLKYLFWRDRKMIFFSHAIAMGFYSIAVSLGYQAYLNMIPGSYHLAPLIPENSALWTIVYFNLAVLAYRIIQRMLWSSVYYGWTVMPMVLPRYIWAAIINYIAIVRATKSYLGHLITGNSIGWDKTSHDFIDSDEINNMRLPLGQLLVKKGMISEEQLEEALYIQTNTGQLLGRVLHANGWLEDDDLVSVLSEKYHMSIAELDPFSIPDDILELIPYKLQRRLRIVPFARNEKNLVLASCRILGRSEIERMEKITGCQVDVKLTSPREINFALHVINILMSDDKDVDPSLLDKVNYIHELFSKSDASDIALHTRRMREGYFSLGEYLVEKDLIDSQTMEANLFAHLDQEEPFGKFLVTTGVISEEEAIKALSGVNHGFTNVMNWYREFAEEQSTGSSSDREIAA